MIFDSGFCDSCINETCRGCPIYEQAVKDDNDDEHDDDCQSIDWGAEDGDITVIGVVKAKDGEQE